MASTAASSLSVGMMAATLNMMLQSSFAFIPITYALFAVAIIIFLQTHNSTLVIIPYSYGLLNDVG